MNRSFEVLLGGPAQRKDILKLYEEHRLETGGIFDKAAKETLGQLLVDAAAGRVYVAVVRGVPAGLITVMFRQSVVLSGRIAELEEFYLSPAYRGRGLAQRFLRSVLADIEAFGIKASMAWVPSNDDYLPLFELEGFERISLERCVLEHAVGENADILGPVGD